MGGGAGSCLPDSARSGLGGRRATAHADGSHGTSLALFVGVMAIARFYTKHNNIFLFIGTGFLGTALLDGYHAVVTHPSFAESFPSAPSSLIPWSWVASRMFLSILLLLSWLAWRRERLLGDRGRIGEGAIYGLTLSLTVVSFVFFAFVPLPRAYYPSFSFSAPRNSCQRCSFCWRCWDT